MRRDLVLISEMIDAAEQAQKLVVETSVGDLHGDRIRRDALLWNITVLGEAAGRVSQEIKDRFGDVPWRNPVRLRLSQPYRFTSRANRSQNCHQLSAGSW